MGSRYCYQKLCYNDQVTSGDQNQFYHVLPLIESNHRGLKPYFTL